MGVVDQLWRRRLPSFSRVSVNNTGDLLFAVIFYLTTSISYDMELEQRMKSTSVNKKFHSFDVTG